MKLLIFVTIAICCEGFSESLVCYNCSASNRIWSQCGGDFGNPSPPFNSSRKFLVACSGDNATCFVRSWTTRSKYAWLVQRGCYSIASKEDSILRGVFTPQRAMACKVSKYPDSEYKLCLCQADWCNTAVTPSGVQFYFNYLILIIVLNLFYII